MGVGITKNKKHNHTSVQNPQDSFLGKFCREKNINSYKNVGCSKKNYSYENQKTFQKVSLLKNSNNSKNLKAKELNKIGYDMINNSKNYYSKNKTNLINTKKSKNYYALSTHRKRECCWNMDSRSYTMDQGANISLASPYDITPQHLRQSQGYVAGEGAIVKNSNFLTVGETRNPTSTFSVSGWYVKLPRNGMSLDQKIKESRVDFMGQNTQIDTVGLRAAACQKIQKIEVQNFNKDKKSKHKKYLHIISNPILFKSKTKVKNKIQIKLKPFLYCNFELISKEKLFDDHKMPTWVLEYFLRRQLMGIICNFDIKKLSLHFSRRNKNKKYVEVSKNSEVVQYASKDKQIIKNQNSSKTLSRSRQDKDLQDVGQQFMIFQIIFLLMIVLKNIQYIYRVIIECNCKNSEFLICFKVLLIS